MSRAVVEFSNNLIEVTLRDRLEVGAAGEGVGAGIAFSLEQTSLQELPYAGQFDAVLTIDAMEHIPPEDWPGVLANLRRAARLGGLLYLTVEELERHHIEQAFVSLSAHALPAVRGEIAEPDVSGYHCYSGRDQAVSWFGQQGLAIVGESFRFTDQVAGGSDCVV